MLTRITPDLLPEWWERASPALENMAESTRGRQSLHTLADKIIDGNVQLWAADDEAFALTAVNDWPTGLSTFEFIGLVGEGRERWLGVLDEMCEWAKEQGCEMVETSARPGWKRVLTDWACTHVFLEKKI